MTNVLEGRLGERQTRELNNVSIHPSHQNHFNLERGQLQCKTCLAISRSRDKSPKTYLRIDPDDPTSPIVHKILTKPHLCLLTTLKEVQHLHDVKTMPKEMFDEWMSINGGNYQLGVSAQCMLLWKTVTQYPCKRTPPGHVDQVMTKHNQHVVRIKQCKRHRGRFVMINWSILRNKRDLAILNELWPWSSEADHTKTNVSAADLVWHLSRHPTFREKYDRWKHLFSTGLYNITICALLVHMIGNEQADKMFNLLEKYRFCCLDMDDYAALFKHISTAIRRTGRWEDGSPASLEERTGCAGWELAIGRSGNKSDWAEEKRKRTQMVVPLGAPTAQDKSATTNAEYIVALRRELDLITKQLVRPPGRKESWEDFVENRQRWVASGSTGGERLVMPDGERIRMNKQAYFDSVSKEEMVSWLEDEPKIIGTASEKFEMGKSRAIYGTGVRDYAIVAYVMDGVEEHLYNIDGVESGLTGFDAIATMVRRLQVVSEPRVECTMVDYADFNYQHTLEAQGAVFESLADALAQQQHHPDKVRASRWVAAALLEQYCKFPQDKGKMTKVTQGMFSGIRATNFINTLLNLGYFKVAEAWLQKELRLQAVGLHNIHQGDDVWISNQSRLWAIGLYRVLESSGLVFQPAKQLFDVNLGEFLRVVYVSGACRGYLARAIGTLIMKPIQNTDVVSPAERAIALNSQINHLVRRGFTSAGADLIWHAIVPYAARAKLVHGAITIPVAYLMLPFLDHGLDLGPPMTAAKRATPVTPIPTMALCSRALEECVPSRMAHDYVGVISRGLRRSLRSEELEATLHGTNVIGSMRQIDRTQCLRAHERDLRKWLNRLKLPPVTRTHAEYEAMKEGETANPLFEVWLTRLSSGDMEKVTPVVKSRMGVVMAAIGLSPFRSLSNTMTATGLDALSAAGVAITSCPKIQLSGAAAALLAALKHKVGECGARLVLDGVRTGSTKYEGEFHPTILSWVQDQALDCVIGQMTAKERWKDADIREVVVQEMDKYVRSLRKFPIFHMISHY